VRRGESQKGKRKVFSGRGEVLRREKGRISIPFPIFERGGKTDAGIIFTIREGRCNK